LAVLVEHHERCREDGAGQDAMRLWGAEKRSDPGRARSARQHQTWRICPSAARSAQRVASYPKFGSYPVTGSASGGLNGRSVGAILSLM
jgi:hypothetical protein